jgi:hypothetical protein
MNMGDVTIAKPIGEETPESASTWISYESPESLSRCTPLRDFTSELHRQRVLVVDIMRPLAHSL